MNKLSEIKLRIDAAGTCQKCDGDGCDPEDWLPDRHPMQMDPDPCRVCLRDELSEGNLAKQDRDYLLDLVERMSDTMQSVLDFAPPATYCSYRDRERFTESVIQGRLILKELGEAE